MQRAALYHALGLCSIYVQSDKIGLKDFCTGHITATFRNQHYVVKKKIADMIEAWSTDIIREDFGDWAHRMVFLTSQYLLLRNSAGMF